MGSHQIYGLSHVLWLAGITCMSIVLSMACRRNLLPQWYPRAALACLLAGGELLRYYTDRFHFPDLLPLNLCNITAWVAVIACLTLWPVAVEFTYFGSPALPPCRSFCPAFAAGICSLSGMCESR